MSKTTHLYQYALIITTLSFILSISPSSRPNGLTQNGLLNCTSTINAKSLETNQVNDLYLNEATLKSFTISSVSSTKSSFNTLRTPLIIPHNEDQTLYINSLIKVKGKLTYKQSEDSQPETKGSSFVQLYSITINQVPQWKQIQEEDIGKLKDVNRKLNQRLMENLLKKDYNDKNETQYEIDERIHVESSIGKYDHAMIEMTFHFNELLWNNHQKAYIKIGKEFYWVDKHHWKNINDDIDMENCSMENKWQNQIKMIIPRRFIIDNTLIITFGVKLTSENNNVLREVLNKCNLAISSVQDKEIISFDNLSLSVK